MNDGFAPTNVVDLLEEMRSLSDYLLKCEPTFLKDLKANQPWQTLLAALDKLRTQAGSVSLERSLNKQQRCEMPMSVRSGPDQQPIIDITPCFNSIKHALGLGSPGHDGEIVPPDIPVFIADGMIPNETLQ
jgi:hypothetical protein